MDVYPQLIVYIFVFVIGAAIGSFLNVVIYRVPERRSLFTSSKCPSCGNAIRPYHNVPVFGWMMLGGKCRDCKEPIGWRYPAIELLTAVIFAFIFWQVGLGPFLPVALISASAFIALIFIDADHMILPNVITYPFFVFALLARLVLPLLPTPHLFSDSAYFPAANLHGFG